MYHQAGLLALGSAGGGQPSHRGLLGAPAVAAFALTFSVPDYSGGTAPDFHRVPECLGFQFSIFYINRQAPYCQGDCLGGGFLIWNYRLLYRLFRGSFYPRI
jgi:hypothetical protein